MTKEKLAELLDAKNKATETWRNYAHQSRDNMPLEAQVELDINIRKTMNASNAADQAYADAVSEFIKGEASADA